MAFQTIDEYARIFQKTLKQNTKAFPKEDFKLRSEIKTLKDLRVAAVMDEFTYTCYEPECQLLNLDINNYREEMDAFEPDMLFIESAWRGKDDKWTGKVVRGGETITHVANWFHARNLPVIFWNKEDPVHISVWRDTARLADYVFTTDADMVPVYKRFLDHDRVYHLHFAAQPKYHNPIEKFERKPGACFAGAYYRKYARRTAVFEQYVKLFNEHQGIEIYDRNLNDPANEHQFPPELKKYIIGTLRPDQIDVAYKGYIYGLNMNSISNSQTMFARRTFELMASNTVVVGNYSCGIKNYFGDLVISTDDMGQAEKAIAELEQNRRREDALRLQALNTVLRDHLYEDRLNSIVKLVFKQELKRQLPVIHVLTSQDQDTDKVQQLFEKQVYDRKALCPVENIQDIPEDDFVCFLNENSFYGEEYLENLALSLRYSDYDGYRKPSNAGTAYRETDSLKLDAGIIRAKLLKEMPPEKIRPESILKGMFLNTDVFNYSEDGTENVPYSVKKIGSGHEMVKLQELKADALTKSLDLAAIAERLAKNPPRYCLSSYKPDILNICYSGPDNVRYVNISEKIPLTDYNNNDTIKLSFDASGDESACEFYVCLYSEKIKDHLGPVFVPLSGTVSIDIPLYCDSIIIGVRLLRGGSVNIRSIKLFKKIITPIRFMNIKKVAILTNVYPSYEDLYRNMFVHARVKSYIDSGYDCSVIVCNDRADFAMDEFEGVNVIRCNSAQMDNALKDVDVVCVHFLTSSIWNVLKKHLYHLKTYIWMHGSEIEPYWRRMFLYENGVPDAAKRQSDEILALWNDTFETAKTMNIHFVSVSNFFLDEIHQDHPKSVELPMVKFHIIHNFIDTDAFNTPEKTEEDRLSILSVRPYASTKYANDLTVKCILELSHREFFDKLNFSIIGDGVLFDKLTEPLKEFANVRLEKRFMSHNEIIEEHKKNGICITPTRHDSQGVSRDEAMSSGLVPVTTRVSCIPEFCDDQCALIAEPEDYKGMADLIEWAYYHPQEYVQMSKNARARVIAESSFDQTIMKEIEMIFY